MLKHEDSAVAPLNGNNLQPLAGISVTVTDKTTGLPASLYADDGITPLAQPLITDYKGYYGFKAPDGTYVLTFSGQRIETFTREIVLDDPKDNPYVTVAGLAAGTGSQGIGYQARGTTDPATTLQDVLDYITLNNIFLSWQPGANADEKFAAALAKRVLKPTGKIIVDGNFDLSSSYTVSSFLHLEGAHSNTSLSYHGSGVFLTLSGAGASGSVLENLSINGNEGTANFFNGKTMLRLASGNPNDTATSPKNVTVRHVRFEWCDTPMALEAAVSCTFEDIRWEHAVYGVRLKGVCLENQFTRLNGLSARHCAQFLRYTGTAAGASGDVPQGNYFTGCTLALQYGTELRAYGGFTDATIASTCATIKADCAFDYGFVNCWIENNIRHSTNAQARLGFIIDFVQGYAKSYIGSFRFSSCRLLGNKIRFSGGNATGYAQTGMTGIIVFGCNIGFYGDDVGAQGLYVGDYLANVLVKGNNIVALSSDKNVVTYFRVRDSDFDGNTVLYEDNVNNAWPAGPSAATEAPLIVSNCDRISTRDNKFRYTTASNLDFVSIQGTNAALSFVGNECPLCGTVTTVGPAKFLRERERVTVIIRTNTEAFTNGSTIVSVPSHLRIQNAAALDVANSEEAVLTGDNCDASHRRFAYQDGILKYISNGAASVSYMRGKIQYSLY